MSALRDDEVTTALEWSLISARGLDAESFLQGQLSQDLASIDDSGGWTMLLAPDSIVITTAWVSRHDGGFDLVVPTPLAEATEQRLRRFLLRSKCTLVLSGTSSGPFATLEERVGARWPGEGEFAASLTPHAFGRRVVESSISFQKGCFTGQELVARLDARGASVPWRMVHVRGPSVERVNEVLESKGPEGPRGVTSSTQRNGEVVGLAFAHRSLQGELEHDAEHDVTIEFLD